MGKPCSWMQFIKRCIFYYKSRDNLYQVLQITRESISGTTSHVRCVWTCNDLYAKIIITIVPSYTRKNVTRLLPLALLLVLHTRSNTDGNKLVIFSSIALYYGDTYILITIYNPSCTLYSVAPLYIRPHSMYGRLKRLMAKWLNKSA